MEKDTTTHSNLILRIADVNTTTSHKDIVVNMDGGVGGSWEEVPYIEVNGQKLQLQQFELPKVDL